MTNNNQDSLSDYVFNQVPLNNDDLLPLDDLKASGSYERKLILPDDMPPVLALGYGISPDHPKLFTMTEDGSLRVYDTAGGGGGGGSTAPIPIHINGVENTVLTHPAPLDLFTLFAGNVVIHGFIWTTVVESLSSGGSAGLRLKITNGAETGSSATIAAVSIDGPGFYTSNFWSDRGFSTGNIYSGAGINFYLLNTGANGTTNLSVYYEVV